MDSAVNRELYQFGCNLKRYFIHSAAQCATIEEETSAEIDTGLEAHDETTVETGSVNADVVSEDTKLLFAKMKELQSLMLKPAEMKPR